MSSRPGNRQIARLGRAGRQNHGVKFLQQFFRRIIFADFGVADKFDAFGFHLFDAAQHDLLLVELHVRDAVHEQAAGAVGALENRDEVAGLVQLRGGAKSRRAGADDGDLFAGALLRRFGHDPAVLPAVVGDGALDVFDGDRRIVDAEHARTFARRRTDAAGEIGEIIRLVQPFERFLPQAAINQIVPFGNQIVDRAAAGHAAEQLSRCGRTECRNPCSARPARAAFSPPCGSEIPSSPRRARSANGPPGVRADTLRILVGLPIYEFRFDN